MTPDTAAVFLQYGALGAIAMLALVAVRVMFTKLQDAYGAEKARADRLEEELRKLNEAIRGEYIRTIVQSAQAISDARRAVEEAHDAVRRS